MKTILATCLVLFVLSEGNAQSKQRNPNSEGGTCTDVGVPKIPKGKSKTEKMIQEDPKTGKGCTESSESSAKSGSGDVLKEKRKKEELKKKLDID